MADTNARAALMRLRDEVHAEWQKPPAPSPNSPADVWYRHFCRMIDRELAALPADEAAGASAGLVEAAHALVMWLDRGFPWELRHGNGELLDLCRNVNNAIASESARKPQAAPVTGEEIEAAIIAASDANFAVGEWDRDSADEPFDAVTQVADAANQELRRLFERLRGQVAEKCEQLAELQSTAAAVFLDRDELREKLRQAEHDAHRSGIAIDDAVAEKMHATKALNDHMFAFFEMKQRAEKAEAEAARYRETLVSKHGGEPLALLDELDEARAQLGAANAAAAKLDQKNVAMQDQWTTVEVQLRTEIQRLSGQLAEARKALAAIKVAQRRESVDRAMLEKAKADAVGCSMLGPVEPLGDTEQFDDAGLREFVRLFDTEGVWHSEAVETMLPIVAELCRRALR